jgi:alanyl-tRNA synthetase
VTGRGAEAYVRQHLHLLDRIASELGGTTADVESNLSALMSDLESQRKETLELRRRLARAEVSRLLGGVREVNGVSFVAAEVEAATMETLREMTDWLRDQLGSAVIVLGAAVSGRPAFVAAVTPDLVDQGLKADQLVKEVAAVVGGGGGGRPTLAQAGGKDPERIGEALSLVAELVRRR